MDFNGYKIDVAHVGRLVLASLKKRGLTIAAAAGIASLLAAYIRYRRMQISSWLIDRTSILVDQDTDHRKMFRAIAIKPLANSTDNHSHPTAAMIRTSMNNAIHDYITSTHRECFSVSMSAADERAGHQGNRYFYTAKDLSYRYRNDSLRPEHVVKMSDVGYYTDLNDYLDGHEVILYEIVPFRAAGRVADATYCFDSESRLLTVVNGDAYYKHHLWAHNTDCVLVPKWNGIWEYLIEKIVHPDFPEYRIIGYFPRRFIPKPFSYLVEGEYLARQQHVHSNWAVVNSQHSENTRGCQYTSVCRIGTINEAFVPTEVLQSIATRYARLGKVDLGAVEMYLENEMKRYPMWVSSNQSLKTIATVLVDFISDNGLAAGPLITIPHKRDAYEPVNKEYRPLTEKQSSVMRIITPDGHYPIVTGAVAPIKGRAAEYCAVEERIVKVRNNVDPPRRFYKYRKEFVERLVTKPHHGLPFTTQTLDERMPRPTQRAITQYMQNWFGCDKPVNKAFIKAEAYGTVNAVRMISTLPPTLKSKYALYIYSLVDDLLHHTPWYAFSLNPQELADRIGQRAKHAYTACATDYSKFDGRISKFYRELESMILRRWAHLSVVEDLLGLHAKQLKLRGVTRNGVGYDPGYHRLSGSSETSAFNSIDNAFTEYCAYRETGLNIEGAYLALGIYGGDDGVSFDLPQEIADKTAQHLGMDLKCETIQRGDVIPFLGRFWYNVWVGEATSSCDWKRQMMKLHLTASGDLTFEQVMVGKALGFWYTDRTTPVIGDWAQRVLQLTGVRPVDVDGDEAPLNAASSWMASMGVFQQPTVDVMEKTMLTTTSWSEKTYHEIIELIYSAKTLIELFPKSRPIYSYEPAVKIDCIHDGERKRPGVGVGVAEDANLRHSGTDRTTPTAERRDDQHRRPTGGAGRGSPSRGRIGDGGGASRHNSPPMARGRGTNTGLGGPVSSPRLPGTLRGGGRGLVRNQLSAGSLPPNAGAG